MSIIEKNNEIKELKKGIQMILTAYNEQKEHYIKIINSMKDKISELEEQILKLKEDNSLYQNKLYTLQKNIKCISKTIYQLREDEESLEEKKYSDFEKNEKNNLNDQKENSKMKLTKDKNNEFFKKYSLNKLELNKIQRGNNKNQELNKYFKGQNNYLNLLDFLTQVYLNYAF